MSPQRAERERKRSAARRRRLLNLVLLAVVVALLAGAWIALTRSQVFAVKTIEVTGAKRLTQAQVLGEARVPGDATLLRFDRNGILKRLSRDPWIASVSTSARFPGTLVLHITERVPVALADTGTTFWYLDGDGRVLGQSVPDTSTPLPVVRGLNPFTPKIGAVSDSRPLQNALAVMRGLDTAISKMVRSISAPSVDETSLVTADGVEIMVGEATQLQQKSALIRDILNREKKGVVFIDVRSVDRPISRGVGK